MEGSQSRPVRPFRPPQGAETVTISYSETARLLVPAVARAFEQEGIECRFDEKPGGHGDGVAPATARNIRDNALLCIVLGARCRQTGWQDREAALAADAGKPVLVFVENLHVAWSGSTIPTLFTAEAARLSAFASCGRPDGLSLWEFGARFFVDRQTAAQFRRAGDTAWRWLREKEVVERADDGETGFEFALVDEAIPVLSEVTRVEARVESGMPALLLGMNDGKRHRLAYSPDIRALLPAPVYPGTPMIGFMHMDFDSGREWPRAGEAPVELRLLGREVYGWHMSEYFWRAFVGSLPKMLG